MATKLEQQIFCHQIGTFLLSQWKAIQILVRSIYILMAKQKIHRILFVPQGVINTGNLWDVNIGTDFNGSIDDVRIYDRALSATEVLAFIIWKSQRFH